MADGYNLPAQTLEQWKALILPEKDWFFFMDDECFSYGEMDVLVKTHLSLDVKTSYLTWSLPEGVFVKKMHPGEFEELSFEARQRIAEIQWELGRGLVFDHEEMGEWFGEHVPSIYRCAGKNLVLLTKALWYSLEEHQKEGFLRSYNRMWVDDRPQWIGAAASFKAFMHREHPHLIPFLDVFPDRNGANCLAAVAFAIDASCDVYHWMQVEDFNHLMAGRKEVGDMISKDVLVWRDLEGDVIHACYVLNKDFVFNKHGQTMFNPWQLLTVEQVIISWGKPVIYR
ncbi:hypothetical protein RKD55_002168 [Rossellomorea marisflavi]